ncbi:hypothetical protein JS530_05120 [Bifidobacterium sp. LC6]|uniref:Polymer-forming cytoskeletal n=1 Tax=Bifidobacterium colobi TaxID=2809026 RepID=A0ABS5UW24_9BIFI|nr:hypothetical protein [Bifidobacterium colobi]MBT1174887.1 hypothetical protein [Bifidobacterium colobi]
MYENTGNTMVHSGTYGFIDIEDETEFSSGVRFRTTMVEGTLEADEIQGDDLIMDNGTVRCTGPIHVHSISGCGTLMTEGDIVCENIALTGNLKSFGNIRCSGDLSLTGQLRNTHRISADAVYLCGVLQGHDVEGHILHMEPLRSNMYARFGMPDYQARSRITAIHANDVEAQELSCKTMRADVIALRDGSAVESAMCSTTLMIDHSSNVLIITGTCRRIHTRTAYSRYSALPCVPSMGLSAVALT